MPHPVAPFDTPRLKRGVAVLSVVFWTAHLCVMLLRAELNDVPSTGSVSDQFLRRFGFALFGAVLGYALYRCLRLVRARDFGAQITLGAALALATASIQAFGNALVFNNFTLSLFANFLYALLYWFWFYFCWTTAYLAFSYSIKVQEQERHAAALAIQAREAQVRALRYQINPHFLFNTLNAVAALIQDAPPRAEEMVVRLSDFFRRSLAIDPLDDLTLAQEVDLQRLYLEIERTRFPERLRFDVALATGSHEAKVPALLLQPMVENAIKHGVARSEGLTCIRIHARLDGAKVEVVVENDARCGGPCVGGEQVGLTNVAERLRSRFGEEATLAAASLPDGGFRNTLRFPLRR